MATVQVTTEQRWGYRLGRRGVRNLQSPACPADALPTARGVGEGIKTTGGSDTARGCKRQKTELLQAQISWVQALELGHGKPGWAPPPAVPAGWESPTCGKLTALRPTQLLLGQHRIKAWKHCSTSVVTWNHTGQRWTHWNDIEQQISNLRSSNGVLLTGFNSLPCWQDLTN